MSKKDFKRLGDDTKKMEKNMKLYHVGLIVNLILIIIIVVCVCCIVIFKPDLFHKESELSDSEGTISNNQDYPDTVPYTELRIARLDNKSYVIGNLDGTLMKIIELDTNPVLLGTYKNRLYYYDNSGLGFINFVDADNYENVEWLKYRQYRASNSDETGILKIDKAYLVNDKIYFKYGVNISNTSSTSGILVLSIDDKDFEDAKQLLPNTSSNDWAMSEDKKFIYCVEGDKKLVKYSVENNASETILSDVESMTISDDKLLYLTINSASHESDNAIVHAATYYLYVYNLSSGEKELIYESPVSNVINGRLDGFAQIFNGDVYYKNNNKIIKYSNGNKSEVFSDESGAFIDEFRVLDASTIYIKLQGGTIKYLKNGNLVDSL